MNHEPFSSLARIIIVRIGTSIVLSTAQLHPRIVRKADQEVVRTNLRFAKSPLLKTIYAAGRASLKGFMLVLKRFACHVHKAVPMREMLL